MPSIWGNLAQVWSPLMLKKWLLELWGLPKTCISPGRTGEASKFPLLGGGLKEHLFPTAADLLLLFAHQYLFFVPHQNTCTYLPSQLIHIGICMHVYICICLYLFICMCCLYMSLQGRRKPVAYLHHHYNCRYLCLSSMTERNNRTGQIFIYWCRKMKPYSNTVLPFR